MLKSDKKRKNRVVSKPPGAIPAFLLKTYEILEVVININILLIASRILLTMI